MTELPILLAEPHSLMRQTVALTASSICRRPIFEASSLRMVRKMVIEQSFAAIIVPLCWDDDPSIYPTLELIMAIRSAGTLCTPTVPVFITAHTCSLDEANMLADIDVKRVLIKPFKARLLIEALAELSLASNSPISPESAMTRDRQFRTALETREQSAQERLQLRGARAA